MYAHKVIEDIQNLSKKNKNKDTTRITSGLIHHIINSTKFHLGEMTKTRFIRYSNDEPHFEKFTQYLRMPYELCWLDYKYTTSNDDQSPKDSDRIEVPKRGMLVYQSKLNDIVVFVFNYITTLNVWAPPGVVYQIRPGTATTDKMGGVGNTVVSPIFRTESAPVLSREQMSRITQDDKTDLYILEEFMLLINSKNIETKDNRPPEKLNLSRAKKGKQEIFTYKTLQLKLPTKRSDKSECIGSGLNHNRIHYCRGHFKEYTSTSPLFGKVTGLWWWGPHARGKNKEGIIEKDYTCEYGVDE